MQIVISIIVGLILAFIASHVLFVGSARTLIPWGIAGLILGWWGKNKKHSLLIGAIYGFVLSFSFMSFGYTGKVPYITRIPPFIILGLFGAVCGLILGIGGQLLKKLFKR